MYGNWPVVNDRYRVFIESFSQCRECETDGDAEEKDREDSDVACRSIGMLGAELLVAIQRYQGVEERA